MQQCYGQGKIGIVGEPQTRDQAYSTVAGRSGGKTADGRRRDLVNKPGQLAGGKRPEPPGP
jgi:hypothetical protein